MIFVVALIAAVLAPLLSIVIFSGVPLCPIALRKKRSAALRSRLAVNRKSTVAEGNPDMKKAVALALTLTAASVALAKHTDRPDKPRAA